MNFLQVFLMAPDPSGKSSSTSTLIMMGLMILVFWLFMIRPQAKKAKQQKQFVNNMQKGDKVVTIAGIHGTINKVNDDGTILLETSPGSYIKIEKSAVSLEWSANANKVTEDKK
ncbi:MAG TPA: preprotein translocase subunit YajC [Ferruginibacter sp.]|nr:preprotein translocase subunit YajC [Ferruginibacter sp.]HRN91090.1 preprotein translocase subunit YajC [Ferruginibacter sp.]HRO05783.1 preprotein translocase subunit YajC [Ferruginibacter sp.]HRO95923.1 preprotein translocase subunit YajC [Ferruginibacter sp.]HRP48740.1 preprotein translocase subunit YajC [Ferruginibacter sp.]